jgi:cytochrome c oxidase subunit III
MKKDVRSIVNQIDKKSAGLVWAETMTYFLLAAISILFLFFAVAFWQAIPVKGFAIPAAISLSTVCIVISCLLTIKIKQFKNEDRLHPFRKVITGITASGALFFVFQFLGWHSLVDFISSGSRNLVLVLLVAHAVHFVVAFGLCIYFTVKAYTINSGADLYIWFLKPQRQIFFKLSFLYWDFLGYLWVILFVIIQVKVML